MSTASQDLLMEGASEEIITYNNINNCKKRPSPLTHDVSLVGEHAPDIKSVAKRLQAAVEEAWPTRGQSRYTQAHVLTLSWEDDDLGVLLEIRQIETIFQTSYRYAVHSWKIPTEKPATRLQLRLADFLKHDGPETLLIVYYAGHAIQDEQRSEPPVWISRRENPARLPSITVQSILSECDSDVLLLYDCCHAIPTTTGITGRGVKEFLAACGFESIAPEVGQDSFTYALIQELGKASYSSISVGELYGRLIDRLRTWKPCISKDEIGQMRLNSSGKPLYGRSKRKTPIHCALTNEPKRRSIFLSPLPSVHESLPQCVQSEPPLAKQARKKMRYEYPSEDENGSGTSESTECPQVIIAIRVDTEDFNLDTWLEWIKDVPPEATRVKIEGIYGSFSTLVLLRIPITTWLLLPDDEAYSFIGFVTTDNLAPALQNSASSAVNMQESHGTGQSREKARKSTSSDLTGFGVPISPAGAIGENNNEIKKSSVPKTSPIINDSTANKMQETKRRDGLQGGSQVPHGNSESKGASPEEKRNTPSAISTWPLDPMQYGSTKILWTCCNCHNSGQTTLIHSCDGCSHYICYNCERYIPR